MAYSCNTAVDFMSFRSVIATVDFRYRIAAPVFLVLLSDKTAEMYSLRSFQRFTLCFDPQCGFCSISKGFFESLT